MQVLSAFFITSEDWFCHTAQNKTLFAFFSKHHFGIWALIPPNASIILLEIR